MNPPVFILGDGTCACALAAILRAPRIGRRAGDEGWEWPKPKPKGRRGSKLEAIRLFLVVEPTLGLSQWIRRHAEARECPLARRCGVLLFGMKPDLAVELRGRDVFARTGTVEPGQTFDTWGPDLALVDGRTTLADLLAQLAELETIPTTTWDRKSSAASCLPELCEAITRKNSGALLQVLPVANRIDWDARCFPHPDFGGDAHAWANRIRSWLNAVTVGVPPEWDEGLSLFLPFERKSV